MYDVLGRIIKEGQIVQLAYLRFLGKNKIVLEEEIGEIVSIDRDSISLKYAPLAAMKNHVNYFKTFPYKQLGLNFTVGKSNLLDDSVKILILCQKKK